MKVRKPYTLRNEGVRSIEEIAALMNCSVRTVSSTYNSAIRKLRRDPEALCKLREIVSIQQSLRPATSVEYLT